MHLVQPFSFFYKSTEMSITDVCFWSFYNNISIRGASFSVFPFTRFVVVCGDGEYIIYTAMALRNKSFGSAQEFVWAHDSSE